MLPRPVVSSHSDSTRKPDMKLPPSDPNTLQDIFKWHFQMGAAIWPAFLHDGPKGKSTPEVYAFLEQQKYNKQSQGSISIHSDTPAWVSSEPIVPFPASVSPWAVLMWLMMSRKWNVAESKETGFEVSSSPSSCTHRLSVYGQVTSLPTSQTFLICKMRVQVPRGVNKMMLNNRACGWYM